MRLDTTAAGSFVVLDVSGTREYAIFLGIEGRGDNRQAIFVQPYERRIPDPTAQSVENRTGDPIATPVRSHTWRAYRFQGRWSYGTSGEPLRLVDVLGAP